VKVILLFFKKSNLSLNILTHMILSVSILSDRRPNFTKQVRSSMSPVFVFAGGEQRLKDNFQQFLVENCIKSKSIEIGSVTLFWELSKPVHAMVKSHWKTSFVLGGSL
jgi:hypothetical protein